MADLQSLEHLPPDAGVLAGNHEQPDAQTPSEQQRQTNTENDPEDRFPHTPTALAKTNAIDDLNGPLARRPEREAQTIALNGVRIRLCRQSSIRHDTINRAFGDFERGSMLQQGFGNRARHRFLISLRRTSFARLASPIAIASNLPVTPT